MSWLTRVFARKRLETDLEKELHFHFETQVAEKMQSGVPEREARRLTRLEFGGIDQRNRPIVVAVECGRKCEVFQGGDHPR